MAINPRRSTNNKLHLDVELIDIVHVVIRLETQSVSSVISLSRIAYHVPQILSALISIFEKNQKNCMFLVSYIFYVVRYVFVWYLFFLSLSSHFILSDFVANKRTYI